MQYSAGSRDSAARSKHREHTGAPSRKKSCSPCGFSSPDVRGHTYRHHPACTPLHRPTPTLAVEATEDGLVVLRRTRVEVRLVAVGNGLAVLRIMKGGD
jgi:hypothetical protein